jgi:integrase
MVRRMAGTTRRPDSRNQQFEQRVPADVVDRLRGSDFVCTFPADLVGNSFTLSGKFSDRVRLSLRTADPSAFTIRAAYLTGHLERIYEGARRGPVTLSYKQIVALSGEIYRLFINRFQDDPGSPDMWAAVKGFNRVAREGRAQHVPLLAPEGISLNAIQAAQFGAELSGGINALPQSKEAVPAALEQRFGWLTDWVLAKHALTVDLESRAKLIEETDKASTDAALTLKRFAQGDYSPDTTANRFPPLSASNPVPSTPALALSFEDLFANYISLPGRNGSRSPATVSEYRRTFCEELQRFIKAHAHHQDPTKVTRAHIVAWRDHLLGSGLSPKTVKDKKIAAIKAVFGRAARDARIDANPADGIDVPVPRQSQEREKGFTEKEALAILKAAMAFVPGRHQPKLAAAIKWTPWLGAYSGGRIAELAQLRGKDVLETPEGWFMRITPEAGSVKSGRYRDVPIHSNLIELGFLEFVKASGDGPLFYTLTKAGTVSQSKARVVSGRVSRWVRTLPELRDTRVQPTHGWRHRFITLARQMGMDEEARNYITGHALRGMGAIYGNMAGLHREIEKVPRVTK